MPAGYSQAEYYAGRSAFYEALTGKRPAQFFDSAVNHFSNAIHLEKNERLTAVYYFAIGQTFENKLVAEIGDKNISAAGAIADFHESARIFGSLRISPNYGEALTNEAYCAGLVAQTPAEDREVDMLLKEALEQLPRRSPSYAAALRVLGTWRAGRGRDYRGAVEALTEAVGLSDDGNPEHWKTLLALGSIRTSEAIRTQSSSEFEKGIGDMVASERLCATVRQDCFEMHTAIGARELLWGKSWRRSSDPWTLAVGRALDEYKRALSMLAKEDQPELYASTEQAIAAVYKERSLGLEDPGCVKALEAGIAELSEAISTLETGHDATELYSQRAEYLRSLSACSGDKSKKADYLNKASQDEAKARKNNSQR